MRPPFIPVRRPLVDQVIASLRQLIEQEGLQPGDRLPSEARLAEQLHVGRSTLREAVRALAHSGEVNTRQGSGTYVTAPPTDEFAARLVRARVDEVFEVRRALEVFIAQTAAERRTAEHIHQMRTALENCRAHARTGDVAAFIAADSRFHQLAAEATGNTVLIELYRVLRRSLERASHAIADVVELQHANDMHAVLLEAIADGDASAAVAATHAHLTDTMRVFESARTRDGVSGH